MQFDVIDEAGPAAETVLLSAGLGGAASYWAPQLDALRRRYRVIGYDQAGTGRNPRALPEGYAIEDMAREVIGILDDSGTPTCHFVGHALGGLAGLALARMAPDRLRSLVVVNGWAKADSHTRRCFAARLTLLRHAGAEGYVKAQPIFLYPATWLAANEARVAAEEAHGIAHFQGEANLRRRIDALLAFDATHDLPTLRLPVLAIAARDDVLVAATQSEHLAESVAGAILHVAAWGGHAMNVTDPAAFDSVLLRFLERLAS